MATAKSTREGQTLQIVERVAKKVFAGRWDREELVNDTVSVYWQRSQSRPDLNHHQLVYAAIRAVKNRNQFPLSSKSIDVVTREPSQELKPDRVGFQPSTAFTKPGDDPAVIAAFVVDYESWRKSLTPRRRAVWDLLLDGERPEAIAKALCIGRSTAWRIREELRVSLLAWIG